MLSTAIMLLWLALPPLAWLFRQHLDIHPLPLSLAVLITGTSLYVSSIWMIDHELASAMRRFDLDHDGEFSPEELTPQAREAIRQWAADTGRNVAPFFAAPVTLFYVSFWFAILWPVSWILAKVQHRTPVFQI